ncbi:MAG: hypothetical protein HUU57_08985 [Bdellovibrio sp.]|nr:hypothetical protein [Bdellovibrio sp.]
MIATPNRKGTKNNTLVTAAISLLVLLTGCAKSGQFPVINQDNSNQSSGVAPSDPPSETSDEGSSETPLPATPPVEIPSYKMTALSWETSKNPERKLWSEYLQNILINEWSSLLNGASDITNFCPTYDQLNIDQKANVWAQIFVAIAKYESAYSPTSRMHETTMGNDPVTNQPVYSEGLLQLSYQDIQWAPWCEFDWSKDRSLSATDPRKTILDPYLNLNCGVGIMAKQIKSKGSIVVSSGVYWAVIKSGGKYQQISNIQSMVKALSLCK